MSKADVKNQIANECICKAIEALMDAITYNLRQTMEKNVIVYTTSEGQDNDVKDTWNVNINPFSITFTDELNIEYNIDELNIHTLIDVHNAILEGNVIC